MRWQDVGGLECSVARALSVCGDRWTLLILRDAFLGTRRFDAFQAQLCITRHRLADRLTKLVGYGVLRKERYQERPPRDEYRLTDKGLDLFPVLAAILDWGDRYLADPEGSPLSVSHRECGAPVQVQLRCAQGHEVAPRQVRTSPAAPYFSSPCRRTTIHELSSIGLPGCRAERRHRSRQSSSTGLLR